ncbi:MAG: hypothetical protein K2N22_01845, partial [Clostridia bacterium]|nr:hypothetical protein [Clostridia bacterium]
MKTKSRNLLTVILALLCAVAVAVGVGFALPKAERISAQAAATSEDIEITLVKSYFLNRSSGGSVLSVKEMDAGNVGSSTTSLSTSMNKSEAEKSWKGVYADFTVGVKVPAMTEYTISYMVNFTCRADGFPDEDNFATGQSAGLYHFYPDPGGKTGTTFDSTYENKSLKKLTDLKISKDSDPTVNDNDYECKGTVEMVDNFGFSASFNSGNLTLKNDSNAEKVFTFSYAAGYLCGKSIANYITQFSVSLSDRELKSKDLTVALPEDIELDYTGDDLRQAAEAKIKETKWHKLNGDWASYQLPSYDVINVIKNGDEISGYEVTYKLTDAKNHPFKLADGTHSTAPQKFKIIVNPIEPTLSVIVNKENKKLLTSHKLSDVTIELDPNANNPEGTIAWSYPSTSLSKGTGIYQYKFTSDDNNYVDKTDNVVLTANPITLDKITATYTQGDNKIFPTINLSDGLPGTLSVVKYGTDGKSMGTLTPSDYTLSVKAGTTLIAGNTCKITVTYKENGKDYTADIDVDISAPQLTGITVSQNEGTNVYESTTMQQLAQMLSVKAAYEDGTTKTLGFDEYTVSGNLVKGTNCQITVTVNDDSDWQTATSGIQNYTVQVESLVLTGISATFNPVDDNGNPVDIYDRTPISDLKPYIKVIATYEGGSTKELSEGEYILEGSLNGVGSTALLDVKYGDQSDRIQVNNIIKAQLVSVQIKAFVQSGKVYDSDKLDVLKKYLVVEAIYAHKPTPFDVTSECTFAGTLIADPVTPSQIEVFFEGQSLGTVAVMVSEGNLNLVQKPTAKALSVVYTGNEVTLAFNGFNDELMTVTGNTYTALGTYKAIISLKDPTANRWSDRTANNIEIEWKIVPLVIDTENLWNKGKAGATLNLPQTVIDLIAAGSLGVTYNYYDGDGNLVDPSELKPGNQYKVEAVFSGPAADDGSVQFKTGATTVGSVSPKTDYKVAQSGAAVFFGKVKDVLTTSYAGLPLWAWLLIAIALIVLLIIIIVVAKKRRKTKEEREEIKARKEEEKQRKQEEKERREEERRLQQERLEEERRLQREKLEAEREMAKAKQEAELEKIRAQAQAGLASAGMASMAMAQPQQQQ